MLKKFREHLYLVTAEAVAAADQLNPHLRYMSTNWNLSALRFRMLEKGPTGERDVEFAKDTDWLVSHPLDPQWIVSIRIE